MYNPSNPAWDRFPSYEAPSPEGAAGRALYFGVAGQAPGSYSLQRGIEYALRAPLLPERQNLPYLAKGNTSSTATKTLVEYLHNNTITPLSASGSTTLPLNLKVELYQH